MVFFLCGARLSHNASCSGVTTSKSKEGDRKAALPFAGD
jgi:hypothetical protein